jgi:hypothetical protein
LAAEESSGKGGSNHYYEISRNEFRSFRAFLNVTKFASPLRCTSKSSPIRLSQSRGEACPRHRAPVARLAESETARLMDGDPLRHCFRACSGYIRAPCRRKSWRT